MISCTRWITLIIALLASAAVAQAQATRTWVSGVGDDANPCSRTAPCKTFAGAISKTAAGGVIDTLDPGGFGAVTITKSITIEGVESDAGILASMTNGIIVNVASNATVTLRNLTIEGAGNGLNGIKILGAGAVHIEDCRINGFTGHGISLEGNSSGAQLFVKNTTIHNCVADGIHLAPTAVATVLVEGVNITGCGNGISAAANTLAVVTDTTASGNASVGCLVGANADVSFLNATIVDNLIGVQTTGKVYLSNTTVAKNATDGLKIPSGGQIVTYTNNRIYGNTPNGSPTTTQTLK